MGSFNKVPTPPRMFRNRCQPADIRCTLEQRNYYWMIRLIDFIYRSRNFLKIFWHLRRYFCVNIRVIHFWLADFFSVFLIIWMLKPQSRPDLQVVRSHTAAKPPGRNRRLLSCSKEETE